MSNVNKKQFIIEKYGLILGFILTGLIAAVMGIIGVVAWFVPCMIFFASVLLVIFCLVCYEGAREYEDECGEQAVEQSNRNNEEANRAWHQVDDLQEKIRKANKRCEAHSYVQELELLCRELFNAIWGDDTSSQTCDMFKERMDALGLLEGGSNASVEK